MSISLVKTSKTWHTLQFHAQNDISMVKNTFDQSNEHGMRLIRYPRKLDSKTNNLCEWIIVQKYLQRVTNGHAKRPRNLPKRALLGYSLRTGERSDKMEWDLPCTTLDSWRGKFWAWMTLDWSCLCDIKWRIVRGMDCLQQHWEMKVYGVDFSSHQGTNGLQPMAVDGLPCGGGNFSKKFC